MKKILSLALSLLMLLSLAACGSVPCSHEWSAASCTVAESCSLCGETRGEVLPHSYGGWTLLDDAMIHECLECGTKEKLPLDYKITLDCELEGKWYFYSVSTPEGSYDCYTRGEFICASCAADGTHTIQLPEYNDNGEIIRISQIPFETADVQYITENQGENKYYLFNMNFEGRDSSEAILFHTAGREFLQFVLDDSLYTLSKNPDEHAALSDFWAASADGKVYSFQLDPDGSFTASLDKEISGIWIPKPIIPMNNIHLGGALLCYQDGGVYKSLEPRTVLSGNDPLGDLQYHAASLDLPVNGSTLYFSRTSPEEYEILLAAQNERGRILGTWDTDTVSIYNKKTQETHEENGAFSISFYEDGSFTSNLTGLADAGWSYQGPTISTKTHYRYDIESADAYDNVSLTEDGVISMYYSAGNYQYKYELYSPGFRALEEKMRPMLVGKWTCSTSYMSKNPQTGAILTEVPGDFSISFNADGSLDASLASDFTASWYFFGMSEHLSNEPYPEFRTQFGEQFRIYCIIDGILSFAYPEPDGSEHFYDMTKAAE